MSQTPEAEAAYPIETVLTAFRSACSATGDQSGFERSVAAAGWTSITPEDAGELQDFIDFAETEGGKVVQDAGGQSSQIAVFRKLVSGETLHIVLSEIEIDGNRVSGCRLFDYGEYRTADMAAIEQFVGRPPARSQTQQGISVADWSPGLIEGQDSFSAYSVPPGNPAVAMLHFSGLALKADTVSQSAQ